VSNDETSKERYKALARCYDICCGEAVEYIYYHLQHRSITTGIQRLRWAGLPILHEPPSTEISEIELFKF